MKLNLRSEEVLTGYTNAIKTYCKLRLEKKYIIESGLSLGHHFGRILIHEKSNFGRKKEEIFEIILIPLEKTIEIKLELKKGKESIKEIEYFLSLIKEVFDVEVEVFDEIDYINKEYLDNESV